MVPARPRSRHSAPERSTHALTHARTHARAHARRTHTPFCAHMRSSSSSSSAAGLLCVRSNGSASWRPTGSRSTTITTSTGRPNKRGKSNRHRHRRRGRQCARQLRGNPPYNVHTAYNSHLAAGCTAYNVRRRVATTVCRGRPPKVGGVFFSFNAASLLRGWCRASGWSMLKEEERPSAHKGKGPKARS